ncbi:MAG: threonine synthase [Candidatus Aminicenantes bacterium]|nr:threonine synthase [Candidatus Aminicenantes bacterium]
MDQFECLACGPIASRDPTSPFCPACAEPLFIVPAARPGGKTIHEDRPLALERFADFLPLDVIAPGLSLGEGATPLVRLERAGAAMGLSAVYAKNEAQNPTGSFKDRGTAVAVQNAASRGFKRIGTVSTGNMAASTAAYGARAGLETFVLLKEGTAETSLKAAGIYSPRLIAVDGDYGSLFRASLEIGRRLGISFMNSIDPYRMEGYKLTAFEIYLQMGRRAPRFLIVPVSSGGHLLGLMRAFEDLEREKLITTYPTFVGVQARGCAPLAAAFAAGLERYERPTEVRTIAHAISNPAPPAGNAVLRLIRDHKGLLLAVTDEEMLEAQRQLGGAEGLFCQPESATTLAALKQLAASGRITEKGGEVVLVLTGSGLKTPHLPEAVPVEVHKVLLSELEPCLSRLIR